MKRCYKLILAAVCVCVSGLYFQPPVAYACSPGIVPDYSLADHVNQSDYVIEGTVIDGSSWWFPVEIKRNVTIIVQIIYKTSDDLPYEIDVGSYGNDSGDCLSRVNLASRSIFFINRDSEGMYHASYFSVYPSVKEASRQNALELISIIGYMPIVNDLPEEYSEAIRTAEDFRPSPTPTNTPRPTFTPSATPSPTSTATLTPTSTSLPPTSTPENLPPVIDNAPPANYDIFIAIASGFIGIIIGAVFFKRP